MKHTYKISGMSCEGCRDKVENALNKIEGVSSVVTLEPPEATVTMEKHVPIEKLQEALSAVGTYTITAAGHQHVEHEQEANTAHVNSAPTLSHHQGAAKYSCPMHPEIIRDQPGACPICGMDLVPMGGASTEEEDQTYDRLLLKFKIAALFTVPIFLISMSEMIHGNPLLELMDLQYWNWVQFILSIPVVFYATWMFFERAWRSVVTWNLNMFTLIGIGAGVAWLFSIISLFFPSIFPDQFKTHSGTVYVYFEAASVILTLVLLGQLLEARAHGKTNSAIKELLKLAPNEATKIVANKEMTVAIDDIKEGDLLRVKPGEKVPVDGSIQSGDVTIDELMISGEPIPVDKKPGD
jgi:Cu2+-exporting ATPase